MTTTKFYKGEEIKQIRRISRFSNNNPNTYRYIKLVNGEKLEVLLKDIE